MKAAILIKNFIEKGTLFGSKEKRARFVMLLHHFFYKGDFTIMEAVTTEASFQSIASLLEPFLKDLPLSYLCFGDHELSLFATSYIASWLDKWFSQQPPAANTSTSRSFRKEKQNQKDLRRAEQLLRQYFSQIHQGNWHQTLKEWLLDQYVQQLYPQVAQLAKFLGRKEVLQESNTTAQRHRQQWGKSEIKGIRLSNDLSIVLPMELGLMVVPELELLFMKKFAEQKLLSLDYRAHEEAPYRSEQKGPIILCIDTSASMAGMPELLSKALALCLITTALEEKRLCYVISFAINIETLTLQDPYEDLPKLIHFLQQGFHGGTDVTLALSAALDQLKKEPYQNADIVVISDFVMPTPAPELLQRIWRQRQQGTRLFAIVVEQDYYIESDILFFFDQHWKLRCLGNKESFQVVLQAIEEQLFNST